MGHSMRTWNAASCLPCSAAPQRRGWLPPPWDDCQPLPPQRRSMSGRSRRSRRPPGATVASGSPPPPSICVSRCSVICVSCLASSPPAPRRRTRPDLRQQQVTRLWSRPGWRRTWGTLPQRRATTSKPGGTPSDPRTPTSRRMWRAARASGRMGPRLSGWFSGPPVCFLASHHQGLTHGWLLMRRERMPPLTMNQPLLLLSFVRTERLPKQMRTVMRSGPGCSPRTTGRSAGIGDMQA